LAPFLREGSKSPFYCRFSPENSQQTDRFIRAAKTGGKVQPASGEKLCLLVPKAGGEEVLQVTEIIRGLKLAFPGNRMGQFGQCWISQMRAVF